MKFLYITTLVSLFLTGCNAPTDETAASNSEIKVEFVKNANEAHKTDSFYKKEAITFDLKLDFGGKPRIYGKLTLLTNSTKGIFELEDGNTIIFNDGKVYHSPNVSNPEKVRFDAYTWSYFFLFPYKMADKGTIWNDFRIKEMNGTNYNVNKLTFESNTGDAPDDWYVVYTDKETNLVATAAYIVTFSKSQTEAEQNPHAITYSNYKDLDGIPIATEWTFSDWNEQDGISGVLGNGILSNIKFVKTEESLFEPKADFIEV